MDKSYCEVTKSTIMLGLLLFLFITAFLSSDFNSSQLPGKGIEHTVSNPFNSQHPEAQPIARDPSYTCREELNVEFLFPHVTFPFDKAGGRTLGSTFDENFSLFMQYKFISSIQRSRKHRYTMYNGHRYLGEILRRKNCSDWGEETPTKDQVFDAIEKCKGARNGVCQQWIFRLHEPMMRSLSSFYTITGRKDNDNHFTCDPKNPIRKRMKGVSFTFEDFSEFDKTEREKCYLHNQNLHLKYLTYGLIDDKSSDEEKLQFAKEILLRLDWFSILEYAEESLDLFEPELGLEILSYHSAFNYNKYEKELSKYSQKARDALFELNYLDIKLYDFAKELFYARLDKHKPEKRFLSTLKELFVGIKCHLNLEK
eukprot:snap_masked-scaffold_42-processed-gene-0.6-mRNA-1 protein AED:1.00 eAED:1.00 QI:0/0/0/0/1/1/3/0/368